jgi:hypothetical protein
MDENRFGTKNLSPPRILNAAARGYSVLLEVRRNKRLPRETVFGKAEQS